METTTRSLRYEYSHIQLNLALADFGQCRRAKQLALFDHEGGLIEHYGKLYQYRKALLDSNPGSTCRLDVDESANGSATFRRIYICFLGVKDAMGRDANNQMYPIAWTVVMVENADNWGWFLHLLHDDLSLNDRNEITIICDSYKMRNKKGLIRKDAEQERFDKERREEREWEEKQDYFNPANFREDSIEEAPFNQAYAKDTTDVTIENIDEAPASETTDVSAMVEDLSAPAVDKGKGKESSKKEVRDPKGETKRIDCFPSGFQKLEVRKDDQSYGVSLQHNVCQCRMWELSGVPCVHVVAAYLHCGIDLDLGVSHWYSQECRFNAYQFSIKPVFGLNMWKMTNDVPPLPPLVRRLPGRPQKARIKALCKSSGSHTGRVGRSGIGNEASGSGMGGIGEASVGGRGGSGGRGTRGSGMASSGGRRGGGRGTRGVGSTRGGGMAGSSS
ncbi:F-box domain containing protein, partial [Tanacetum coccineum]